MLRYISRLPPPEWSSPVRRLAILGSTGSIGRNALDVVARCPDRFRIVALAGGSNVGLLAEQAARWRPDWLAVRDEAARAALLPLLPPQARTSVGVGQAAYERLASLSEVDVVLSAQTGAAGLRGTLAAVEAGKVTCVANKESLVLAGALIRRLCARTGASILPVDSEHNAIFQLILGRAPETVRRIILTASGGPFRGWSKARLGRVRAEQALKHPNWKMGEKITIDSATLMNKGLEVLEAHALYDLPSEDIDVVVHPQSVIHSLVELTDRSCLAQMGLPDMRLPIAHCLNWPHPADTGLAALDLAALKRLTFENPDREAFPCLSLARRALRDGRGLAVALNAANEEAVEAFLRGRIPFMEIPDLIAKAMDIFPGEADQSLPDILAHDAAVRAGVRAWMARRQRGQARKG
jgi:1-deoxy-D-xylulose-5-phosphate reductoisomerase